MIRKLGGQRAYLTIPSAGRPANVPRMTELVGSATWYVPEKEARAYLDAGAPAVKFGSDVNVTLARNRMLDDAFQQGAVCIQIDDDLQKMQRAVGQKAIDADPQDALDDIVRRLAMSDFKMAGTAPTNNAYFTRQASSTNLFVIASLIAVKPNPLRFDTDIRIKHDYDLTVQHWQAYGGVLRCDDWLPTFRHANDNPGGCNAYRSIDVEEADIAVLFDKWGGLIRRHPRREHEVLLRLPRPQKAAI